MNGFVLYVQDFELNLFLNVQLMKMTNDWRDILILPCICHNSSCSIV